MRSFVNSGFGVGFLATQQIRGLKEQLLDEQIMREVQKADKYHLLQSVDEKESLIREWAEFFEYFVRFSPLLPQELYLSTTLVHMTHSLTHDTTHDTLDTQQEQKQHHLEEEVQRLRSRRKGYSLVPKYYSDGDAND
jgi:hypothetical protein